MLFETIRTLSALPGVSGCEEQVRYEILRRIEGKCIYRVDPLGNVLAFKKGRNTPAKKLMLSAHMDEVGLIVTHIESDGLLRFATVGGIDRRTLPGKAVQIGTVFGVIGQKALHQRDTKEREQAIKPDQLAIDIGAADEQAAAALVQPGERAVFLSDYTEFGDGYLRARALDNRVGCALLLELIDSEQEYDLHFAFTVQEETGTVGAKTAAAQIEPDIGLILETTTACDLPEITPAKVVCALGKGPVLSFMDRGTIYDSALYRTALETARAHDIPCQPKAGVYGGNESRSVQIAGRGTKVLAISVPCRYLHTPSCVVKRSDIEQTSRLLPVLIETFAR